MDLKKRTVSISHFPRVSSSLRNIERAIPESSRIRAGIAKPKRERISTARIIGTQTTSQMVTSLKRPKFGRKSQDTTVSESSVPTANKVSKKTKRSTESCRQGPHRSRTAVKAFRTELDRP